jgi:hypothetical protein
MAICEAEGVLVAMGIDADDVVHLLCKHPDRFSNVGSGTPVWSRKAARQVCK